MKTICAYCLKTIIEGPPDKLSHGICDACEKLVVAAELMTEGRTAADMLLKSRSAALRRQGEALSVWVKYGKEIGLDKVPRTEVKP